MKRTTGALCLLAIACTFACSKNKEIKDLNPPGQTPIELTVTGFTSNDTLSNTLSAGIRAEHSSGIKGIEVFANDELIASAEADSLSFNWNTLDMPDGSYSVKVVVSDDAGNKKEQTANVVVSNALVKIDRGLLVGGDASAYFITDSAGQVIGRANFLNDGTHTDIVSLYPSEAFSGSKINLTRVSTSDYMPPQIEHFVGIKRGTHLSNQPIQHGKGHLNEYQTPIPITVKNVPDYDKLLVSTNALYYQLPTSPDYDYALPYTVGSKGLVLIEQNDEARYGLFEIPEGSTQVELDAALADLIPTKQTIQFPTGLNDASLAVFGQVVNDYDEFYTFTDKNFSGNSVDIFYPEDLVETLYGTLSYTRNRMTFAHHYYRGIPENIPLWDIQATVNKLSISDFEVDINGDFGYYRVLFENKPYVGTGEGYIEVIVFAPPGQEAFSFPDIAEEIDIPGFNLAQFKPSQLQLYAHDVPSSFSWQFNKVSNVLRLKGASYAMTAALSLR